MTPATAALAAAIKLFDEGAIDQAQSACLSMLKRDPRHVDALRLLAMVHGRARNWNLAVEVLSRALDCDPGCARLWFERGAALYELGQACAACDDYRASAELDPTCYEAVLNVGAILEQRQQLPAALEWTQRAVALRPACARGQYNLGNVLRGLGHLDRAVDCFQRALHIDPQHAKAHWNLAQCYLLQADFGRGWAEYAWREAAGEVFLDRYPQPTWDGSPLARRTLLVHAEQGIGDEILFASCYPGLLAQAGRCLLVCEPRLETLFRRSFPQAQVHGYARRIDRSPLMLEEPIDFQIAAGSVPGLVRRTLADFPQRNSFLVADPHAVERWRQRFSALGSGLKIGISWRAGGKPTERARRTTRLVDWAGLLGLPGIQWVNLQYGETLDELAQTAGELGATIHDPPDGDPLVDLDEFAAKLSALDLVISVGNATAHLAGALGVAGWIMVPHVPAWRWHFASSQTPWYPSLRLYRQTSAEGWHDVLAQLQADLQTRLSHRHSPAADDLLIASVPASHPVPGALQPAAPTSAVLQGQVDSGNFVERALPAALEQAQQHHQAGDLQQAEAIYREILSLAPRQPETQRWLGLLARQTGRVQLAVRCFERAIAAGDAWPETRLHLAETLRESEQWDAALTAYSQAIGLQPQSIAARYGQGCVLARLERTADAAAALEAALDIDPAHLPTIELLAEVLPSLNRSAEAAQLALVAAQLRRTR